MLRHAAIEFARNTSDRLFVADVGRAQPPGREPAQMARWLDQDNTLPHPLRLNRREALWHVDLPATLPVVMTGIRLAVAAALLVAVTAEMLLSTDGIGVYLLRSQETFRIADGLAGIVAIACVGWAVNAAFLHIDRRLLHWHYATTAE